MKKLLSVSPLAILVATAVWSLSAAQSFAQMGQAIDGQLGLQLPATPIATEINNVYDLVNWIIIGITIFVLILLAVVIFRFNERANPEPDKVTHNTLLEVAWTVVPIFILVIIAIPSFKLLNLQYAFPKPDLVVKATGYQWYWSHEYPDQGIAFDSVMLTDEERAPIIEKGLSAPRLLAVDNEVVLPLNKVTHLLVTAGDVIHDWAMPSFGTKIDAVPGRVTATWIKPEVEGIFFGQCSELCGKDHAFMPIAVRVVKEDVFNTWSEALKAKDKNKAKQILETAALELAGRKAVAESGAQTTR